MIGLVILVVLVALTFFHSWYWAIGVVAMVFLQVFFRSDEQSQAREIAERLSFLPDAARLAGREPEDLASYPYLLGFADAVAIETTIAAGEDPHTSDDVQRYLYGKKVGEQNLVASNGYHRTNDGKYQAGRIAGGLFQHACAGRDVTSYPTYILLEKQGLLRGISTEHLPVYLLSLLFVLAPGRNTPGGAPETAVDSLDDYLTQVAASGDADKLEMLKDVEKVMIKRKKR